MRGLVRSAVPLAIGVSLSLGPPSTGAAPGALSVQTAEAHAAPHWVTRDVEAPRLRQRIFESAAAGTTVSYFVYTPEAYDTETTRRFPVLYWLHGSGGGLDGVPRLVAHFDAAIRAGKIPPMLVVFPNGLANSLWVDSKDGKVPMETVVVRELLPRVDSTFRTIATREGRMVEGFSMGGYGAARMGFEHPDLFGAISILSGGPLQREFRETPRATPEEREQVLRDVFGGDHEYFRTQSPWVLAEANAGELRGKPIRLVIGDRDEMLAVTREFEAHLNRLGISHAFLVLSGVEHKPLMVLRALGEENWRFYREAFGVTASPGGRDSTGVRPAGDAR